MPTSSYRWVSYQILTVFFPLSLSITGHVLAFEIEGLAGVEIDSRSQGYRYLGIGLTQSMDSQWKVLARLTGAGLHYEFVSDDETLGANVYAVTPSIGAQYRQGSMTLGLIMGEDIRSTTRASTDGGHETEHETGLFVQGEMDYWFARLNDLSLIISYSRIDDFFWGRGRLKHQITNQDFSGPASWFIGTEVVGSGNVDFKSFQFGGLIERVYRPLNLAMVLKGGYKNSTAFRNTAYAGLELYVKH